MDLKNGSTEYVNGSSQKATGTQIRPYAILFRIVQYYFPISIPITVHRLEMDRFMAENSHSQVKQISDITKVLK